MEIIKPNFLTLYGRTSSFEMTDHLQPEEDQDRILTDICEAIVAAHQTGFPTWTRLISGFRIFEITPQHPFFFFLDEESQSEVFNCLIFQMQDKHITVTHFGPFGLKKTEENIKRIRITIDTLEELKEKWRELKSPDKTKSEEEKKKDRDGITRELEMHYLRCVEIIESNLESKKNKFADLINRVFEDDKGTAEFLIKRLAKRKKEKGLIKLTAKIAEKVISKIAAKTAAKVAAKTGAKVVAKTGAKAGAKAIPVAGAVVGLGFGIWRLCHGDAKGALLEVTSGAASCVPGAGTAVSVAIDAGIAGRDIVIAKEEAKKIEEEMKAEMERIQTDLNDLGMQYDQAKEKYEFTIEVLKDPGFEIAKLQHEISILEEILEKDD